MPDQVLHLLTNTVELSFRFQPSGGTKQVILSQNMVRYKLFLIYNAGIMRLKATIAYDGTQFCGWQVQKNRPTVQSTIQEALQHICRKPVHVMGAGRTDTGVHAIGQVAHFDWDHPLPLDKLSLGLNGLLPEAIRIVGLEPAPSPDFHARFHSTSKIYLYQIDRSRFACPFERRFSLHYPYPMDEPRLNDCARLIEGEHEFRAFQATGTEVVTTTRNIYSVAVTGRIELRGASLICIRIHSNGFLRKMMRFLVGTMIEIASSRRPISDLTAAFETGERKHVGTPAAARGLFLERVFYGDEPRSS